MRSRPLPVPADARAAGARDAAPPRPDPFREDMLRLHQGIEVMLAGVERRIIHFTSTRRGEGTSTIVRAYGRALAETMGRSVLLLDANEANPEQHLQLGLTDEADVERVRTASDLAIYRTSCPNLSVSPLARGAPWLPSVFDPAAVAQMFAVLRSQFDAVLVDSSPILGPGPAAVSSKADGVVLVLEAERTRWPVALRARAVVEGGGGTVLGVVLNKRRYHIPEAIYRWL